jgi:pimeloyl-ACP methyl ester carboxylesterase
MRDSNREEPMNIAQGRLAAWSFCVALVGGCSGAPDTESGSIDAVQQGEAKTQDVTFQVKLRETGSATIHASVYSNPRSFSRTTVLAVHGLSETGFTFEPLARAIFADRFLGAAVRRVVAIDMPGHGDSTYPAGLPNGARFGDLLIEDNVSVVLQSIDALRRKGFGASVLMGHSMGGLEVQASQEALLAQGSSLRAHGISSVVLLAPVPAHGRPWTPASSDPSAFIVTDATLGTYLQLTPEAFVFQAFTTKAGMVAATAPTPAEVAAGRYVGPEPITTLLELVEQPIPLPDGTTTVIPRPSVREGAFGPRNGTLATVVSFSEDVLVPAADLKDLYEYLTGDKRDRLYRPVGADDAVHATYISNPGEVVAALRPMF